MDVDPLVLELLNAHGAIAALTRHIGDLTRAIAELTRGLETCLALVDSLIVEVRTERAHMDAVHDEVPTDP